MKSTKLVILSLVALAANVSASAIQFTTGGGRGHMFVTSDGSSRVPAGSLVRVGYLMESGNIGSFQEFATTTISHPGSAVAVQVGGFLTIPAASTTVATAAKGAQIYLWVYNTNSAANASQAGIFTSQDSTWRIPSGFTGDPTETSNLSLSLGAGLITAQADPAIGGAPSFSRGPVPLSGQSPEGSIFRLDGIPEPSTSLLAMLALMGVSRRRR
jgi:PEP-CTERM motif